MGFTDLFKGKEYREQIETLEKEKATLEAMLTPELQDANKLKAFVSDLQEKQIYLENSIQEKTEALEKLDAEIAEKRAEIIVDDEIIELESFSFYKPRYSFVNADEYKDRLTEIREKQKQMIKNKTAATCSTQWTVDGNKAKGTKMTNDSIKVCLRSFNCECDIAISSVKFNTYERCKVQIDKAYRVLNKSMESSAITISKEYLDLKIEELQLALEYQLKKQDEKEALKELRAQQREEARLAKEIEEARKAIQKEQRHYKQAYESLNKQIDACSDDAEKVSLLEKRKDIESHLEEITKNLENVDYREANKRAGYVYVISNIGSFGKDIYKIGMTRRLDPTDRIDELGDASVPFNFDIHAMIFSDDAPALEYALHKAFEDKKVNMINQRREFFHVSLEEIKEVVRKNHDKTVEFIEIPDAEQFRETQQLLRSKR